MNQVSAETITRPAGFWTSLVVDAISVFAALGTGWLYRAALAAAYPIWFAVGAASIFAIASVIAMLVDDRASRRGLVIFLQVAAFSAFFADTPLRILLPAMGIAFVLLGAGHAGSARELSNSLEVRFFKVTRIQLRRITTALVVLGLAFYAPQWRANEAFMSYETFEALFRGASGAATRLYPEVRFTSSVDAFAKSVALTELKGNALWNTMPENLQAQAYAQATTQVVTGIKKTFGIDVQVTQSLSQFLYNFITLSLERWRQKFGDQFLLAWAIAAFFVVRGIGIFFSMFVAGLAFGVYQVLLATNVIEVIPESQMREKLRYAAH